MCAFAACGDPSAARPDQNIAFVTSTVHTGSLGGIAGGDAICTDVAHDAGLGGTWVAWLSTASTSAFSRVRGVPGWVRVDGTPIATSADELVTQHMRTPIALDETGEDVRGAVAAVWTGTQGDGSASPNNCTAWTSETAVDLAEVGDARGGSSAFSLATSGQCNAPRRLYCFETDRTSAVAAPMASGRIAFVSRALWVPNPSGITSADNECQTEATMQGLPGTYLALLAPPGATAASRFDRTGPPWINTAGTAIADTAEHFFSIGYTTGFLDLFPDGSPVPFSMRVWGGEPDSFASVRCMDWTSAMPSYVELGIPVSSEHRQMFAGTATGCEVPDVHLYCLQQ
jgi:hypothetical protein